MAHRFNLDSSAASSASASGSGTAQPNGPLQSSLPVSQLRVDSPSQQIRAWKALLQTQLNHVNELERQLTGASRDAVYRPAASNRPPIPNPIATQAIHQTYISHPRISYPSSQSQVIYPSSSQAQMIYPTPVFSNPSFDREQAIINGLAVIGSLSRVDDFSGSLSAPGSWTNPSMNNFGGGSQPNLNGVQNTFLSQLQQGDQIIPTVYHNIPQSLANLQQNYIDVGAGATTQMQVGYDANVYYQPQQRIQSYPTPTTGRFDQTMNRPVNSQQVQTYNAVPPPISSLRITTVSPDEGVSQSQQYATPVSAQHHGFHSNISQETVNIVGSDEPSLVQNDNSKYYSSSEIDQQKFYHTVGQGDRLHQTSTAKTSNTSNTASTGNASNTANTADIANIANIANGSNTSKGSNTSNTSTPATSIKTTPSAASQPAWTQSLSNQMDADEFWTAVMTNIPLPVPNTLSQMPSHWTPVTKYKWGIVHIIHAIKNSGGGNVPSEKKGFLLRILQLCNAYGKDIPGLSAGETRVAADVVLHDRGKVAPTKEQVASVPIVNAHPTQAVLSTTMTRGEQASQRRTAEMAVESALPSVQHQAMPTSTTAQSVQTRVGKAPEVDPGSGVVGRQQQATSISLPWHPPLAGKGKAAEVPRASILNGQHRPPMPTSTMQSGRAEPVQMLSSPRVNDQYNQTSSQTTITQVPQAVESQTSETISRTSTPASGSKPLASMLIQAFGISHTPDRAARIAAKRQRREEHLARQNAQSTQDQSSVRATLDVAPPQVTEARSSSEFGLLVGPGSSAAAVQPTLPPQIRIPTLAPVDMLQSVTSSGSLSTEHVVPISTDGEDPHLALAPSEVSSLTQAASSRPQWASGNVLSVSADNDMEAAPLALATMANDHVEDLPVPDTPLTQAPANPQSTSDNILSVSADEDLTPAPLAIATTVNGLVEDLPVLVTSMTQAHATPPLTSDNILLVSADEDLEAAPLALPTMINGIVEEVPVATSMNEAPAMPQSTSDNVSSVSADQESKAAPSAFITMVDDLVTQLPVLSPTRSQRLIPVVEIPPSPSLSHFPQSQSQDSTPYASHPGHPMQQKLKNMVIVEIPLSPGMKRPHEDSIIRDDNLTLASTVSPVLKRRRIRIGISDAPLERFNKTSALPELNRDIIKRAVPSFCRWGNCDARLASEWHLAKHVELRKHVEDGKVEEDGYEAIWECPWEGCIDLYWNSAPALRNHVYSQHVADRLACPYEGCRKRCNQVTGMEGHIKRKHADPQDRRLRPLTDCSPPRLPPSLPIPPIVEQYHISTCVVFPARWRNSAKRLRVINMISDQCWSAREPEMGEHNTPYNIATPLPHGVAQQPIEGDFSHATSPTPHAALDGKPFVVADDDSALVSAGTGGSNGSVGGGDTTDLNSPVTEVGRWKLRQRAEIDYQLRGYRPRVERPARVYTEETRDLVDVVIPMRRKLRKFSKGALSG